MADDDPSFRLIADSAPVPIWVTRLDRHRSFVNRAYVDFLGLSYDEAVSFDWRAIIHPEDIDRILAESVAGEASLKPFTLVGRYRRGDGAYRWLSSISNPRWDSENRHIGFIGVAHDITEAKQAEIESREREAQLSAFISQSTAGFAQVDLDGYFTLVNDHFCTITGWSREDLVVRRMQDITHPDDLPANLIKFERAVRDGTPYAHEKRYIRPDGSIVWVNNSVAVINRADSNQPYGVLAVTLDVTARRESETALRKASESVRLAIEGAGMATWELDLTTMEGPWSANRFELLGYTPTADGRSHFSAWLERVHPDDLVRARTALEECFEQGTPFEIEYRILRADTGEERWVRSHGSRIREDDEQSTRFVGVSFDITERKATEMRQQLLIDELNHRVKNMLAIVQSIAAQSLREGITPDEANVAFQGRLTALSAAHGLLTKSLWEPTSMRATIEASCAPLASADRIAIDGPEILLQPKTAVTFALAVHELGTNAIKYGALSTPSGTVDISWTFDPDTRRLFLEWKEEGGPLVVEPTRSGFGTRMLQRGLSAEFEGKVEMTYDPKGLRCTLEAVVEI